MPQYTTTQIQQWISRANKALYKLGTKSTDERFFENDNTFEDEKILIYCLKKAVSWLYTSPSVDAQQLASLVSLLISRITIYDFGKQLPMYNTGTSEYVGLSGDYISIPPTPPAAGTAVPDDITLVGGVDITVGVTSFSDARLLNKRYRIVRNSINFYDWYKGGSTVFLTGVGDNVLSGDIFVIQFY
jgi:hypothetical protein